LSNWSSRWDVIQKHESEMRRGGDRWSLIRSYVAEFICISCQAWKVGPVSVQNRIGIKVREGQSKAPHLILHRPRWELISQLNGDNWRGTRSSLKPGIARLFWETLCVRHLKALSGGTRPPEHVHHPAKCTTIARRLIV